MANYQITGFLGGIFLFYSKDDLRAWIDGAKHALWAFAINKDGQKFVGSGGKTFAEAVEELYNKYKEATGEDFNL